MRLIEIRLLEGPNVYRLEPVVKLEVAVGRRRTWYGSREPEAHALVRLGAAVAQVEWAGEVALLAGWVRRLRAEHGEGRRGLVVHRSSDPGHWIVTWPWRGAERSEAITQAAFALASRRVSPEAGRESNGQRRVLDRWSTRIAAASATPPGWIRDADRRMPVISISGTNGKSTTTRLISRILVLAARHVGTTTSDGILVDERMVDAGDWTGPGGAQAILGRSEVGVAVLETARGGIVLRGVGYESNEASVLTNVSSDHLDLQGIHTLPELAEVKATICRITKPDGWVILNADDRYVAAIASRVRAHVAYFTLAGDKSGLVRSHLRSGGRAYLVREGTLGEAEAEAWHPIAAVGEVPIAFGGAARHNVANALAAAAGARALGASIEEVRRGLLGFRPTADSSPGRLNVYRRDASLVVVDFAHNEAGLEALMDVVETVAGPPGARRVAVTAIIGTAGDRPDETLRGIGRIAALRADRIAIKETPRYLRGRTRESAIGELRAGTVEGGWTGDVPVYESETEALAAELDLADSTHPAGANEGAALSTGDRPLTRVIALLSHEDREGVFDLLRDRRFEPVESLAAIASLAPL